MSLFAVVLLVSTVLCALVTGFVFVLDRRIAHHEIADLNHSPDAISPIS